MLPYQEPPFYRTWNPTQNFLDKLNNNENLQYYIFGEGELGDLSLYTKNISNIPLVAEKMLATTRAKQVKFTITQKTWSESLLKKEINIYVGYPGEDGFDSEYYLLFAGNINSVQPTETDEYIITCVDRLLSIKKFSVEGCKTGSVTAKVGLQGSKSSFYDTTRTEPDDYWNEGYLEFTTGNNAGQKKMILDYDKTTGLITTENFTQKINTIGDEYIIYNSNQYTNANPADVLWEVLTNIHWGLGFDNTASSANIDIDYQTWLDSKTALTSRSVTYNYSKESIKLSEIIKDIMVVSNAYFYTNNQNKIVFKVQAPPDFDDTLPETYVKDYKNESPNIISISNYKTQLSNIYNKIIIKYNYDPELEIYQNEIQETNELSITKYGKQTKELKTRFNVAQQELESIAYIWLALYDHEYYTISLNTLISKGAFGLIPGDFIIIKSQYPEISEEVFEVWEIQKDIITYQIKLKCVQSEQFYINYQSRVWAPFSERGDKQVAGATDGHDGDPEVPFTWQDYLDDVYNARKFAWVAGDAGEETVSKIFF